MKKAHWGDREIRNLILESDKQSYNGRYERLKFLISIENKEQFSIPALVYEYYEEARLCWYVGAFVATIVMAQLSFEELFRSHYRVTKGINGKLNCGKKTTRANFYDLIDEAYNENYILEEEAKFLHNLRKNIRNPYVHVRDIEVNSDEKLDLKKPNFFIQYLKIKASEAMAQDVENEAKESIKNLIALLPKISGRFGGL